MGNAIISVYERAPGHVFTEQPTPPNYPEGGLTGAVGVLGWTEWGPLELTRVSSYEQWKAVYGGSGDLPTDKQIKKMFMNSQSANSKLPLFFKRVVNYTDHALANSITATKSEGYLYDANGEAATIGTATADGGNSGGTTAAESGTYIGEYNGTYRFEVTTVGAFGTGVITAYFTPDGLEEVEIDTYTPGSGTAETIENGLEMTWTDFGSGDLTLGDIWTVDVTAEGMSDGDRRIKVYSKYYGAYGDNFTIATSASSDGVTGNFKLTVKKDGIDLEEFDDLSVDVDDPRYFKTYVNLNSGYIEVEDLASTNIEDVAIDQENYLSGGTDGDPVDREDYQGAVVNTTGLFGFTETKVPLRLAIFDAEVEATPSLYYQDIDTFIGGLGKRHFAFDVVPSNMTTEIAVLGWRSGSFANDTKDALCAVGWLYDEDDGEVISPTGALLGKSSKVARELGVWREFSGPDNTLIGFSGVASKFSEESIGKMNEQGLSVIINEEGTGIYLNGIRTLTKTEKRNYKHIPQALLPKEIEYNIEINTGWVKFKPLSASLYGNISSSVSSILAGYNNSGAFNTEDGAPFAVICDNSIQTLEMKNKGITLCKWGIRTRFHNEFMWFDFTNLTSGATL